MIILGAKSSSSYLEFWEIKGSQNRGWNYRAGVKQIQGKQGLVRNIGKFGKSRVRQIEVPLYNLNSGEDFLTDPAIYSREPEEDLPYKKDTGTWQKFWKECLRNTKILFCGCGMKCFPPQRGPKDRPILKQQIISCHIFQLKTFNSIVKAPTVELFRLKTLRERYNEHPSSF